MIFYFLKIRILSTRLFFHISLLLLIFLVNIKNEYNEFFKHLRTFIMEFFFFFVKIYYKYRYIKFYLNRCRNIFLHRLYISEKVKTH